MFIKRKTNPGKTYAYAMLLSFKTPLTYTFFFNFRPDNCVLCKAAFVGHNLNFTGHCPILMLKFRPERQQFFTTSNLVSVFTLDYLLYMRLHLAFQKDLEMILHTLVQHYTLIFTLNIGRRVGFCCFGNQWSIQNPGEHLRWSFFVKMLTVFLALLVANQDTKILRCFIILFLRLKICI